MGEDSSSSSSSSAAKPTTSKSGRKKININEQELHGPFNFFTHRPVKETKLTGVSSSTTPSSASTAASDNAKSNGSKASSMTSGSLREDLQRVLQEHEGQKSS